MSKINNLFIKLIGWKGCDDEGSEVVGSDDESGEVVGSDDEGGVSVKVESNELDGDIGEGTKGGNIGDMIDNKSIVFNPVSKLSSSEVYYKFIKN